MTMVFLCDDCHYNKVHSSTSWAHELCYNCFWHGLHAWIWEMLKVILSYNLFNISSNWLKVYATYIGAKK